MDVHQLAAAGLAARGALALCVLLAGCAATRDDEGSRRPFLLPPARRDLVLITSEKGQVASLLQLVEELGRATGQGVLVGPRTRQALEDAPTGLEPGVRVAASQAYAVVEGRLHATGCAISALRREAPGLLAITSVAGVQDEPAFLSPLRIESGALPELESHPALMVELLLELKHAEARDLVAQFLPGDLGRFRPQGRVQAETNSILLRGRGADVLALARTIQAADASTKPAEPSP